MNWGMSTWKTGRRNAVGAMRRPIRKALGRRGAMMSLLALGVGATVFRMARNRNAGDQLRRIWQPIKNRFIG